MVEADLLAMLAQQHMGFGPLCRAFGQFRSDRLLNRFVHARVVAVILASIADTGKDAKTVRLQRQARGHSAEHEYLLGAGVADVGELLQSLLRLIPGKGEDAVKIAREMVAADARNFQPAEDARFGAHAAARCPTEEQIAISGKDGLGREADFIAQPHEHFTSARIGQEVAGVLPQNEFEGSAGGGRLRSAMLPAQEREDF